VLGETKDSPRAEKFEGTESFSRVPVVAAFDICDEGVEGSMILVTGAAGLNGSTVVREFSWRGVPVRALVRDRSKASGIAGLPHVQVVEGDMSRGETLGPALAAVNRVLMISSSVPQMVDTQCRFIDVRKAAGIAHVVKFSGRESGIGFNAKNFCFTRMHEEIERYLEASGVAWTHLRPSQFMQVYLREVPSIVSKGVIALPYGDDLRLSPVDVQDIAKIAFAVLTREGYGSRSFDITGPQALTMVEIADAIGEAIGRPVHYQSIEPKERRSTLLAAGIPSFMVDAFDEQVAERRRHPQSHVTLDAHELFGVKPTTFEEFARRHAKDFSGE
jgi:uncharacterized protein YbjT (DUF2867 family)